MVGRRNIEYGPSVNFQYFLPTSPPQTCGQITQTSLLQYSTSLCSVDLLWVVELWTGLTWGKWGPFTPILWLACIIAVCSVASPVNHFFFWVWAGPFFPNGRTFLSFPICDPQTNTALFFIFGKMIRIKNEK